MNRNLLLILAVFCTLLIGYLSLTDISSLPKLKVENEDKLYHFLAYFVLNSIWLLAILPFINKTKRLAVLISVGIILFGIVIEIFQEILTDIRVFDIYDIIANSIAVIVSFISFKLFEKFFLKNINSK